MSGVLSVRDAIDASLGGGLAGWVQRMRADHGGTVSTLYTPSGVYSGCRCGEVMCTAALWLAHVDDLIAAYEAKVDDLARETLHRTDPTTVLDGLREMVDNARKEGYESITLTDLEHAIDLAEEHAYERTGRRLWDCERP